jgi:hypothetical protein
MERSDARMGYSPTENIYSDKITSLWTFDKIHWKHANTKTYNMHVTTIQLFCQIIWQNYLCFWTQLDNIPQNPGIADAETNRESPSLFQSDLSCRNTKQTVGAIYTRTNFVTLKYVTDGWGTESNGFKLVITAFKDKSKYMHDQYNISFCRLYSLRIPHVCSLL